MPKTRAQIALAERKKKEWKKKNSTTSDSYKKNC